MKQINDAITINPTVKFGKPVIKGTRVPVDLVIGKLAGGTSTEELIQEYNLTREQILAALKHALSLVQEEQLVYNPANYAYTNR